MPNLNDVAVDIIGVVTIWNLTHMYYNLAPNQRGIYMALGAVGYGVSTFMIFKKYC
jgi:hypothetical protein